jgi:hypothetical protein
MATSDFYAKCYIYRENNGDPYREYLTKPEDKTDLKLRD